MHPDSAGPRALCMPQTASIPLACSFRLPRVPQKASVPQVCTLREPQNSTITSLDASCRFYPATTAMNVPHVPLLPLATKSSELKSDVNSERYGHPTPLADGITALCGQTAT